MGKLSLLKRDWATVREFRNLSIIVMDFVSSPPKNSTYKAPATHPHIFTFTYPSVRPSIILSACPPAHLHPTTHGTCHVHTNACVCKCPHACVRVHAHLASLQLLSLPLPAAIRDTAMIACQIIDTVCTHADMTCMPTHAHTSASTHVFLHVCMRSRCQKVGTRACMCI